MLTFIHPPVCCRDIPISILIIRIWSLLSDKAHPHDDLTGIPKTQVRDMLAFVGSYKFEAIENEFDKCMCEKNTNCEV